MISIHREDALHSFKSTGFSASKHLKVTFIGEPGVDAGGLLREFFELLLRQIASNNSLFRGSEISRVPNHNIIELSKKTYFYIGCMFAASIVHGGPGSSFLSHSVADYILKGFDKVNVSFDDVPDLFIREKLIKVSFIEVK